jgi:hypothetical protein
MLDAVNVPAVTVDEVVTRYLMYSKWSRSDQTIKHEAFMPPPDLEFSVTRLLQASENELWQIGSDVACESGRSLHGRADISVNAFFNSQLIVSADQIPKNPNHAKVTGWPTDSAKQMLIAKKLAATPNLRRIAPPL